jgi:GTP-binding protein YchF
MLKAGIIGLPNVGKSTLFNALVENAKAQAANFPFCTIEPNKGIVSVPDQRLQELGSLSSSQNIIPTKIEFVDIAGLVKGASKGEGLGNKFLSNIREVDAIVHVVRCFEDSEVIHVSGKIDPLDDIEIINLELNLADLSQLQKRRESKEAAQEDSLLEKIEDELQKGLSVRSISLSDEENLMIKQLGFLTAKPIVYATNLNENDLAEGNDFSLQVQSFANSENTECIKISAQVESELIELEPEDKKDYLMGLGVEEGGLKSLIKSTYKLLGLKTYFTTGEKETKAWTIKDGMTAPQAAGVIHTDFEKGFIRAQTISYQNLIDSGSISNAKTKGLLRSEGKEYVVNEGDVMEFLFNV